MSVYFIEAGTGEIKIGSAKNPASRLSMLRTGSPIPLTLKAVMPGGRSEELDLHRRFAANKIRGKWFKPNADILALIDQWPHVTKPTRVPTSRADSLVRKVRDHLKVTQADLADMLGINQSTVARIEAGREPSKPVRMLLEQLAKS